MDISYYVNILSGIGTFISSIIALFALKEIAKQRRTMYQPKIYLNEFALAVKGNPFLNDKEFYFFHLHNLYEPVDKNDSNDFSVKAQFFLENIGYGVASKVRCKWSFDYISAAKQLSKLESNLNYQLDKGNSLVITKNAKYHRSYDIKEIEKISKIDFIKPESLQKNSKPTIIPSVITNIYMDYTMIKNKMYNQDCIWFPNENFENFPNPKLELFYEDLAGKEYKVTYEFKMSCCISINQMNAGKVNTRKEFAALIFHAK